MKSVKIISEELGVSKQTIFNNIKRLNIETIKHENTSFVKEDKDIEKIIQRVNDNKKKYGFQTDNKENNESRNISIESKNNDKLIEILQEQIEKQERRYETTIEFYRKELQERSKLLENQQILALESNKKVQKLEDQLEEERQLNYSFEKPFSNKQNIDEQEATYTTESVDINQQQEKKRETEIQRNDIYENISDESTHEEVQKKNISSNQNENEFQRKVKEGQSKKGFWSRLFGG